MSDKKINLEEILHEHVDPHCFLKSQCYERVIDAMKEACRQALELAAENAKCGELYVFGSSDDEERISEYDLHGLTCGIDEQSILDTINQIK